jgi:hypothetical protein
VSDRERERDRESDFLIEEAEETEGKSPFVLEAFYEILFVQPVCVCVWCACV